MALAAAQAPRIAGAQSIVGRVLDQTAGTAVVAADVQLVDRSGMVRGRSIADTAGLFRVVAPMPGVYRVRAASLGYATLESIELNLEKGLELELELRLSSRAVALEPLRIVSRRQMKVGRLAEYYDRAEWTRRTGFGRVFMRDDIDRLNPFTITSLLRGIPTRVDCPMTYLLDGLEIDPQIIDSMIQPQDVEGVEVYRGFAQVPSEYSFRAGCGLTLIWSRIDPPGMKPFTWKRVLVGLVVVGFLFGIGTQLSPR